MSRNLTPRQIEVLRALRLAETALTPLDIGVACGFGMLARHPHARQPRAASMVQSSLNALTRRKFVARVYELTSRKTLATYALTTAGRSFCREYKL